MFLNESPATMTVHPVHALLIYMRDLVRAFKLTPEAIKAQPMIIPAQLIIGISSALEAFYENTKNEDFNVLFAPFISYYRHQSERSYGRVVLNADDTDPFQLVLIYHPKNVPTGTGRIHDHRRLCWSMALDEYSFEKTFKIDPYEPMYVREVSHKVSNPKAGVTFDGLQNPSHPYIHQVGFSQNQNSFRLHCYWAGPTENPNGLSQYILHP